MKLTLGFSPCPNDCFVFDALVHRRIPSGGLEFDVVMEDVEELNRRAFAGEIDVTKLSYYAYAFLTGNYALLDSGSALGSGVGPLLIAAKDYSLSEVPHLKTAIPGKYTTANFLFSLACPSAKNKKEMIFSDIESAVLGGEVDAGVIIHENRFTYAQRGLKRIIDLGEWWEKETGAAIPLGGIVIRRSLPAEIMKKVNGLVRASVEYAFAHPQASREFVKAHAQEMSEEVRKKHIDLYVNKYSVELGGEGRRAVQFMLSRARQLGMGKDIREDIFVS